MREVGEERNEEEEIIRIEGVLADEVIHDISCVLRTIKMPNVLQELYELSIQLHRRWLRLFLYQSLPHFLPTQTIPIKWSLGELEDAELDLLIIAEEAKSLKIALNEV